MEKNDSFSRRNEGKWGEESRSMCIFLDIRKHTASVASITGKKPGQGFKQ